MIKCQICNKDVESIIHENGKDYCRKCLDYKNYLDSNFYYGIPEFILKIAYLIGKPMGRIFNKISDSKEKICESSFVNKPFTAITTMYLKGYGNVSVNRVRELERRVILPYDKPNGGYYVGRIGENGKIQERVPNYSK